MHFSISYKVYFFPSIPEITLIQRNFLRHLFLRGGEYFCFDLTKNSLKHLSRKLKTAHSRWAYYQKDFSI